MKKIVMFVFIFCLFLSCSKKENKAINIEKAFYYWKSNTSFGEESIDKIKI
jgi:hypothetical protein